MRFMRMHGESSLVWEQRDLRKKPPAWLATWHGDGIVSRASTIDLIEAVGRTRVELTDRHDDSDLQLVRSDDAVIGELGADHFLESGFQLFCLCGLSGNA